jgi:N-acetylglucosamine-6-phosphate deacetylase
MRKTITAQRLLTQGSPIEYPSIVVEDGCLVRIDSDIPNASTETLAPAFFDIHVHGAVSHDFMNAEPREIAEVGRFLAGRGVAHYLPTTVTGPIDKTLRALGRLADAVEQAQSEMKPEGMALPVGIHLEGPFVSHVKRGVHPAVDIIPPSVALFDRFYQAARGHIRLMTLAPELPGALELIGYAKALGVRTSLGHSNATAAEAEAAVAAGASSATHTFNAMRGLDHREPGILGTVLDSSLLYAEAICDGVHITPSMVRMWLKMKGEGRAILVTDGMSATGMPDGVYALGDLSVEVKEGVCLSQGTLAGSVLTMDQAVENLRRFTGSSLGTAVRLASSNPAKMLGMEHLTRMTPGSPANFNLYDEAGCRCGSILRGQRLSL